MLSALLLASTWLGCPKAPSGLVDQTLPEASDPTRSIDPQSVLEEGSATDAPAVRARALALLVRSGGAEPWGRAAIEDGSDWVRRAGIEALGSRADAESLALLGTLVANPVVDPYLRGLAAVRAPNDASRASLQLALSAERESWRIAPLALAALRLGDESARGSLQAALRAGEFPLDLAFFLELGRSGEPGIAEALKVAQGRVEEELVLSVAAARLMLGDDTGEQALRNALSDGSEERRLEVLDVLVEVDHPTANTLLRRASAQGPNLVTWYANLAMAARAGSDADLFTRAYANEDRDVRQLAVRFAGRSARAGSAGRRVERAVNRVILEGLRDPDGAVRAEACRAAAGAGLVEARSEGERLLSDTVEGVRVEASGLILAL